MADLNLDGEAISLIQPPSSVFNQPSFEQAEMIFRAKSAIKNAPVQNVQWDEILMKEHSRCESRKSRGSAVVEVLQGELRQNFDMVDRMEPAVSSYEQLGGADESFDDLCKKCNNSKDNLLDLLKKTSYIHILCSDYAKKL